MEVPIHSETIDAIAIIIREMKSKMIKHVSKKLNLDEEEMRERYLGKFTRVTPCKSISINGIVVQDGPVFLDPPERPKQVRAKTRISRGRPRKKKESPSILTDSELLDQYIDAPQLISLMAELSDRASEFCEVVRDDMKEGKVFEKSETKPLLQPLNQVLEKCIKCGLLERKERSNLFNKYLTNVLHNADPTRQLTMRKDAKKDPDKFVRDRISAIRSVMIKRLRKKPISKE